ncbi:MAG: hypothetical protein MPW16_13830 [Candidatus Manganitrophus sp.]|nr:MAG: hypothetical protein MPW16_13830 [Candidatus Manganitrophus sp.]
MVGDDTELPFPIKTSTLDPQSTGALWVDTSRRGERLFLGEPKDPTCTLPTEPMRAGRLPPLQRGGEFCSGPGLERRGK